jgi:type II secretory pathway pseudopilin PulG
METSSSSDRREAKKRSWVSCLFNIIVVFGILLILAGVALGPMPGGIKKAPQSSSVQSAHALGLAMYSYANDNSQVYPDGKSSTEVCQQLMDGGYVTDPSIFYIPAPGKTKAAPGQKKLKPENVCWDVTAASSGGLSSTEHTELPLLFVTGYRVSYTPGGAAIPLTKSQDSLMGDGAAVFYVNNSARWMNRVPAPDGTSSIPNFVPPDYKPDGKTYRQLTPDGVLPP